MYYIQAQDMNDKGKRKVTKVDSSSSTTVFDAFSPVPVLPEMRSEGKGKSKQHELPGRFLRFLPALVVTDSPYIRVFQS
jgi:hypothetical protein